MNSFLLCLIKITLERVYSYRKECNHISANIMVIPITIIVHVRGILTSSRNWLNFHDRSLEGASDQCSIINGLATSNFEYTKYMICTYYYVTRSSLSL